MPNNPQLTSETAKGIALASEKAFEFLDSILTNPVKELTGILTDKVKFWRFKNQVNTILRAHEFLRSQGIQPRKMKVKDLSNLLEFASFEEDVKMQERWAALLANAADPNNPFDICSIFSQILNQISPQEVSILDYIYGQCFWKSDRDRPFLDKRDIIKLNFTVYEVTLLIFDNLLRLRLIEEEPPRLDKSKYDHENETRVDEIDLVISSRIRLSEFGVEFVRQSRFE